MQNAQTAAEKFQSMKLDAVADRLLHIRRLMMKIPDLLYALLGKEDEDLLTAMKAGTVAFLSLFSKLAGGRTVNHFTKEDWEDIAEDVADYAILLDGRLYSVLIFELYAKNIECCVRVLKQWKSPDGKGFPPEKLKDIEGLAKEIHKKTKQLQDEKITEPAYVEECLWLCLEAMIKQLSLWYGRKLAPEFSELGQAVSMLAFEYGRYMLYAKEQALLAGYLEKQEQLDEELQARYDAFEAELEMYSRQFMNLVDNAFTQDVRSMLTQSADLARAAGVAEEEILKSVADTDDYFLQ